MPLADKFDIEYFSMEIQLEMQRMLAQYVANAYRA